MRRTIVLLVIVMGCGTAEESASESAPRERPTEPAAAAESPSAQETEHADPAAVCQAIVTAGIGTNCRREVPDGANARARMRFDFDLVSVPGHQGAVLSFDDADDFDATVRVYEAVAEIAGSHRYGNRDALIFVQLNHDASLDVGDRTRALVEAL